MAASLRKHWNTLWNLDWHRSCLCCLLVCRKFFSNPGYPVFLRLKNLCSAFDLSWCIALRCCSCTLQDICSWIGNQVWSELCTGRTALKSFHNPLYSLADLQNVTSWNWSLPTAAALLSQRPLTCCGLAPLAVRRSWLPEFPQVAHLSPKCVRFS